MSQTEYLYPRDYYYYPAGYALPGAEQPVTAEYRALVACLWVFGVFCALAGFAYFLIGDKIVCGAAVGVVALVLAMYSTPFGLFVLFSMFAIENAVVLSGTFTISKAMGVVVAISFLVRALREKVVVTTPLKVAGAMVAWALLSGMWAVAPLEYTAMACLTLVLNAALALIVINTVKDSRSLYLVLCGFIAGAIITSVMVLAGFAVESGHRTIKRATLSEDTQTLVLALAIGMGMLANSFTFFQQGRRKKLFALACVPLFFMALVRTQGRMPTIASIAAPVIALILAGKRQNRFKYMALATLMGGLAFGVVRLVLSSNLLSEAEKQRIYSQGFEESGRLSFWQMGLNAFMSRPFHGYGTNNFFWIPANTGHFAAHNTFVALAVDLGLIGLGLVLVAILLTYLQVLSISDIKLKWLGLAFLIYPVMCGMTVTNYLKREFWYSLAIAMAVAHIGEREKQQWGSSP